MASSDLSDYDELERYSNHASSSSTSLSFSPSSDPSSSDSIREKKQKRSIKQKEFIDRMGPLIAKNARETRELFSHSLSSIPSYYSIDEKSARLRLQIKVFDEFKQNAATTQQKNITIPPSSASSPATPSSSSSSSFAVPLSKKRSRDVLIEDAMDHESTEIIQPIKPPTSNEELLNKMNNERRSIPSGPNALIAYPSSSSTPSSSTPSSTALMSPSEMDARMQLIIKHRSEITRKPKWHAPWKLMRVIAGHAGWVRTIAVDHTNQWFASGSVDRTIKLWDLASGRLMLTLTGHVSTVRALAISSRHPYMFSAGEDRSVKNWDLEQNKVIRHYHGHLSAVYSIALHPTLDLLFTGGRDSTVRVWDIRSKNEVGVLAGHSDAVASLVCQGTEPQVISGSHDSTVRCWDLAKMQPKIILTHHQKSVRSLLIHPTEYTFASASSDNIKVWKCPEATFLRNISGHNATINATAMNEDDVFVSGGDNGSVRLWDWSTGHCFQSFQTIPQPGSLESESGIMALAFDQSGSRLITGEVDKSIKVYKEDPHATEETHPLNWKPERRKGPIH